jgi:hypothetical protein
MVMNATMKPKGTVPRNPIVAARNGLACLGVGFLRADGWTAPQGSQDFSLVRLETFLKFDWHLGCRTNDEVVPERENLNPNRFQFFQDWKAHITSASVSFFSASSVEKLESLATFSASPERHCSRDS